MHDGETTIPILGPLGLTVRIKLQELAGLLGDITSRLQDPRPFFVRAGRILRKSFAASFAEGGRPPWKPLAESTVKRKAGMLDAGAIPRRTATGAIPRRFLQRDPKTGQPGFSGATILIQSGGLRDSWAQKGARGNVEEIGADEAFYGSQYVGAPRQVTQESARGYHVLTKKAQRTLAKGGSARAMVPLALIHERGTQDGRIPARPTGVPQEEDVGTLVRECAAWIIGEAGGEK